jgi:hypothetical protein
MAFKRMGNHRIDEWCHGDRDHYVPWNLWSVMFSVAQRWHVIHSLRRARTVGRAAEG